MTRRATLGLLAAIALLALPAASETTPSAAAPAIRTLTPPAMPCALKQLTGDGEALYLLDRCSNFLRWDPRTGASASVELERPPMTIRTVAVSHNRIAVLAGDAHTLLAYDRDGRLLHRYRYPGRSLLRDLAVLGDTVAATPGYDAHLLVLFDPDHETPRELIANPLYWPEASPHYRSEADVHTDGDRLVVVDRQTFMVYVVDPASGAVERYEHARHPDVPAFTKPSGHWGDGTADFPTGFLAAVSSAAVDGAVYLDMVDRRIHDGAATLDDAYLEIARARPGERGWTTVGRLADCIRFAGSYHLTLLGDTAYLLMPAKGVVHAVPLDLHPDGTADSAGGGAKP